ncbi:hypothetical protein CBD41_00280 [bacterium TMED181]|nr:hypothetical protein [Planctomycetota bacterium]OUW47790.1 MAG: hypothetical protein CBD41_00280 [bacterium TMED181]
MPSFFRTRSAGQTRTDSSKSGFTLIELMIVVAIIGVLSTLVTKMIQMAQARSFEANAKSDVSTISSALEAYMRDEGVYPAWKEKLGGEDLETFNCFPILFENLQGERPPEGRGGKNTPYSDMASDRIAVIDEDFDDEFKRVGRDDLFDPEVDKYYLDPWSEPYFYRENKSKRTKEDWMLKRRGFDLWSVGPDGVNDACFGHPEEDEEYDDIGNW